jgi:hypothetical protein
LEKGPLNAKGGIEQQQVDSVRACRTTGHFPSGMMIHKIITHAAFSKSRFSFTSNRQQSLPEACCKSALET